MTQDVTYSSYLDLDRILAAQHPASDAHDEMLFIIVHQASELWLKLCLHELTEARAHVAADDLRPAFKMLARVARAQGQLIQSWDVLSKIGRAHVCTPVTNAHLVCRLLLENQKKINEHIVRS